MAKILLVDDEMDLLKALTMILRSRGYDVTATSDGSEAERLIHSEMYDLIISDIRMTPVDGIQLLSITQNTHPETPVILITAYATLDIALDAIKSGAFDFVTKPFKTEELLATVQRALDYPRIVSGNIQLDAPAYTQWQFGTLIAKSAGMKAVCQRLEQLALTNETVLILGEKGTGKRLVAQTLHSLSRRKSRPFMAVDCSAYSESDLKSKLLGQGTEATSPGFFETTDGGTVLLENINGLSSDIHPHILRLIKSHELIRPDDNIVRRADVRVLTTSTVPLPQPADDNIIHNEWFQTISAISLSVPPLRERGDDLLPLMSAVVNRRGDSMPTSEPWTLSAQAYDILERYPWPGNMDELEHIMIQAMAPAQQRLITVDNLPPTLVDTVAQMNTLSQQQFEREELRGKSFREYVRMKQKELSPIIRSGDHVSDRKA